MHRHHHPGEIYGHNRLGRVRGEVRRCLGDTCDYVTRAHIRGPGFQGEWQAWLKPTIFGNHLRKSNSKRRLTTITIEPLVVCICMCDTMTSAPGQCGHCLPGSGDTGETQPATVPALFVRVPRSSPSPSNRPGFFHLKIFNNPLACKLISVDLGVPHPNPSPHIPSCMMVTPGFISRPLFATTLNSKSLSSVRCIPSGNDKKLCDSEFVGI